MKKADGSKENKAKGVVTVIDAFLHEIFVLQADFKNSCSVEGNIKTLNKC